MLLLLLRQLLSLDRRWILPARLAATPERLLQSVGPQGEQHVHGGSLLHDAHERCSCGPFLSPRRDRCDKEEMVEGIKPAAGGSALQRKGWSEHR
jgi:hypothetical protein